MTAALAASDRRRDISSKKPENFEYSAGAAGSLSRSKD
jgi:hypothetical protein